MNGEQKGNVWVVIVAILCIFILEIIALRMGINGKVMTLCIGAICALAGASIPKILGYKRNDLQN